VRWPGPSAVGASEVDVVSSMAGVEWVSDLFLDPRFIACSLATGFGALAPL